MLSAQLIVSFLAISQLVFTSLHFILARPVKPLGRLAGLYCVCMIAYILDNLPQLNEQPFFNHVASLLAIMTPGVFWLICRLYFTDGAPISKRPLIIIALFCLLRFVGVVAEDFDIDPSFGLRFLFFVVPNLLMLGFVLHIVLLSVTGYRDDLVRSRRRLRWPLAMSMAVLLLFVVAKEMLLLPYSNMDTVLFAVIFLVTLCFNLLLHRLEGGGLLQLEPQAIAPDAEPSSASVSVPDQQLMDRIGVAMSEELTYQQPGLTIKAFAQFLDVSEHRLRRVINHQLHYRNFNQFLNHYRIEEAGRRLCLPQEAHLPILTIALDVGYRSLSSFNKAFLARYQITPSQYRKESNP